MISYRSLEADLFGPAANDALLRGCYLELHPQSGHKWQAVIDATGGDDTKRAGCFHEALRAKTIEIGKGDYAQLVASAIEDASPIDDPHAADDPTTCASPHPFTPPGYIKDALTDVLLPMPTAAEKLLQELTEDPKS